MKSVVLLFLSLSCCPGSVGSASAVEDAYGAVVSVVSPGQRFLTGESLRSLFNTLQNRVQCGEVPCGKVSFIGPNLAARLGSMEPGAELLLRGREVEVQELLVTRGNKKDFLRCKNIGRKMLTWLKTKCILISKCLKSNRKRS